MTEPEQNMDIESSWPEDNPCILVPLDKDELEMLGCALSLLAQDESWSVAAISELADKLYASQRSLRQSLPVGT